MSSLTKIKVGDITYNIKDTIYDDALIMQGKKGFIDSTKAKFKPRKVTFKQELIDNNIELSVRHLKQFFKFGHGASSLKTKAVHDVSFDIKKGECFGLVGESGCGKTTTGRSLIRLYHITSGSIYFEGHRISAGKRWNEKEIKWTKYRAKRKIAELHKKEKQDFYYAHISEESKKEIIEEIEHYTKLENDLSLIKDEYERKLFDTKEIEDVFERQEARKQAKLEYKEKAKDCKSSLNASLKLIKSLKTKALNKENTANIDANKTKVDVGGKPKDEYKIKFVIKPYELSGKKITFPVATFTSL